MFITQYVLRLKSFVLDHSVSFWTCAFPFILATLFYFAFGSAYTEDSMDPIPVAAVLDHSKQYEALDQLLDELGSESSGQLLDVIRTDDADAERLLREKKVDGIISAEGSLHLVTLTSGTNQSILKTVLDNYQQKAAIFQEIAASNPDALPLLAERLAGSSESVRNISLSGSQISPMMQFFYALVAMSCMYTSFFGLTMAMGLQGNLSDLAARRTLTPAKKSVMMLSDYLAVLTISGVIHLLLFVYLRFGLGVDFGVHTGFVFLTIFAGCLFGLSMGTFISCVTPKSVSLKVGISISICMLCCFLAGLMSNYVPTMIEQHAPIINRLNPAYLLANSFYCLTYYDDFKRFAGNLTLLAAMALLLGIASVLSMRRKKYASI